MASMGQEPQSNLSARKPDQSPVPTRRRFRVERVTFVTIASIGVGIVAGPKAEIGPIGVTLFVGAIMLFGVYGAARVLFGGGRELTEDVPQDAAIPVFDLRRFVREGGYFVAAALALLVAVVVARILKS